MAGKKGAKGQAGPTDSGADAGDPGISVAAHPHAARSVRRAKGLGGLGGFLIAAFVSLGAGVPFDQAGVRSVVCGIAGYLLAWGLSVAIWRQLVIAEIKAHNERQRRRLEESAVPAVGSSPIRPGS